MLTREHPKTVNIYNHFLTNSFYVSIWGSAVTWFIPWGLSSNCLIEKKKATEIGYYIIHCLKAIRYQINI